MKYIMLRRKYSDGLIQEIPIVFPSMLVHADVAVAIRDALYKYWPDIEIVRAGELGFICETGWTSGKSESLGLESDPEDCNIILGHDYFHGIK